MKFYTKHFFLIIKYNYNISSLKIILKKKKIYYSFSRNLLKRIIFIIFNKFNFNFYGYKILIIFRYSYCLSKYFKYFKNDFLFFLEIICILNKVILFIK